MPEHRGDAGDVGAEIARHCLSARAAQVALRDVSDHHGASRVCAEHAPGVDGTRVPASASAQIDATARDDPRDDVGRGYGAEEVAEPGGSEEADDAHEGRIMRVRTLAGAAVGGTLAWALTVRGSLTVDLGVGRRYRSLGPATLRIAAPREVVFDVIAEPYLGRTPQGLRAKLEVLERGDDVVLAAHHTPAYGLTATTVETVRFERPERVHFRLVRGPVPHVVEVFELRERDGETELEYSGELGTDLWLAGRLWGAAVARTWEATVRASLDSIRSEAERRAKPR